MDTERTGSRIGRTIWKDVGRDDPEHHSDDVDAVDNHP